MICKTKRPPVLAGINSIRGVYLSEILFGIPHPGLFSGLLCYQKTVGRAQSLTEFQNSILITKHF